MSVLERLRNDDTETLSAPAFVIPRVDLLPLAVRERRTVRLARYGLGAATVAAIALVGGLRLVAAGAVAEAEDELAVQQTENTRLQTATGEYSSVSEVYRQVERGEAMLQSALASEVRWSYFLTDLSLSVPQTIWLTNLAVTQTDPAAGALPDGSTVPGAAGGAGSLTFSGKALDHDDVAAFLEALVSQKGVEDPYFSSAIDEEIGTTTVVSFSSTAVLTEEAFSGRYRPDPTEAG